jgi:hypothetical protein
MNQTLGSKSKNSVLFQELVSPTPKSYVKTLATSAVCYACNKGLEEGTSITAKYTTIGTFLFCDKHYPQN